MEANQAQNLALSQNFSEMKQFLKTVGSNRRIVGGRLNVSFAKPWNWLYEIGEKNPSSAIRALRNPSNRVMWTHRESNPALVHAMDA